MWAGKVKKKEVFKPAVRKLYTDYSGFTGKCIGVPSGIRHNI